MAERHLNLLLQQQNTARTAASRPNTPSAAGVEALALQAYGQLEQQLQEVSAQLELERQQADELLQQKDALNKQLRIVSMEREELKQQTQGREEASAASAQLQDTLDQLSEAQEKLTAAEAKLDEARDTNKQLTEQLQHANTAVEVAKASALAATSSVTAETHAQLQEASARAASLEAQLLASKKNSAAVADSNKILQQQLRQSHVQGKRLITMNRHLMKHAEQLEGRCQQQATLVSVLKEDKAAMAAELGRIYDMLQDMAGAQQRQQKLQQQLLEIIAQQQQQQQCQEPGKDTGDAVVGAAGSDAGSTQGAVAADSDSSSGLVRVLSSAMLAVAMPIMGQFVR
jgi:chromosome segregation ATPase